jgi:hypothetical protein
MIITRNKYSNSKTKNNKFKYKDNNSKTKNKTKKLYQIPSKTPKNIAEISQIIYNNAPDRLPPLEQSMDILDQTKGPVSYAPTVNQNLVILQSIERENVHNCNNDSAFDLKEPLKIGISGKLYGKTCVPYYDPLAVKFLLKNLSANKHVKVNKIVPPIQNQSNCWFNTMFITLFISDKGRKFLHFFRQLMIEGVQADGSAIPQKLRNGLALLNYAIDACITGNKYAYILDTNSIIRSIYENIPDAYKEKLPYITDVGEAGNPIRYYGSLIYYLHNKALQLLFIKDATNDWKNMILKDPILTNNINIPHFIIIEIYDGANKTSGKSGAITNKARSFFIKGAKYSLDSCIIRDTTQQHFCAVLTCENKEMAYDGMSYHRLVSLEWKKYINSDYSWGFEGSNNSNGEPLKWNFLHGYQMLLYYRVK